MSEIPLDSIRVQLQNLRAEAEEVGWFRWQSDSFVDQRRYRLNYIRCMELKLKSEQLSQTALRMMNGQDFIRLDADSTSYPREIDLLGVEEKEQALTEIAEEARESVNRLGLLVQMLAF